MTVIMVMMITKIKTVVLVLMVMTIITLMILVIIKVMVGDGEDDSFLIHHRHHCRVLSSLLSSAHLSKSPGYKLLKG